MLKLFICKAKRCISIALATKAEFDAALSDFNARLTTFEAGINSKIDSQVSSYLDRNGIWNGLEQDIGIGYARWDMHNEFFGGMNAAEREWYMWGTNASGQSQYNVDNTTLVRSRATVYLSKSKVLNMTKWKRLVNHASKSGLCYLNITLASNSNYKNEWTSTYVSNNNAIVKFFNQPGAYETRPSTRLKDIENKPANNYDGVGIVSIDQSNGAYVGQGMAVWFLAGVNNSASSSNFISQGETLADPIRSARWNVIENFGWVTGNYAPTTYALNYFVEKEQSIDIAVNLNSFGRCDGNYLLSNSTTAWWTMLADVNVCKIY